jgi:cobyrinic acid a,c-diamide synthase
MTQCPRLTIAGIGGDSGKTVVSVGLSRVWCKKGYQVIPFKKGPDYIDMSWLGLGASHPCYNLDLFFMTNEQVLFSYSLNTQQADIAIIEGNRGLYDGMDVRGSVSTAEVAKILCSPVILVVNCTKVTRTVAALVLGCQKFDPNVSIRGVILNQLATHRHETIIRKSIEHYCNLPVVGAIPRLSNITFPGRHLGLVPPQEHPKAQEAIEKAAETTEKFLDVDKLWQIAHQAPPLNPPIPPLLKGGEGIFLDKIIKDPVTIGIIRDSAFQFYYPENIEALKRAGAEIVEFSALTGDLPLSIHALYIGGGFPETHAAALSANESLRQSIRKAVEDGLPIYAECGGLMYLGEKLVWEGKDYPMVGVLPIIIGVSKKPQGHGYSIVEVDAFNPFFRPGQILRGHEFHYSHVIDISKKDSIYFSFNMKKGQGIKNNRDGLCYKNVLATYTHLHALGTKEWIDGIMSRAVMCKEQRQYQETP